MPRIYSTISHRKRPDHTTNRLLNLEYATDQAPHWYPWQNMQCWCGATPNWYIHKNNNGDFDVSQVADNFCGPIPTPPC